MPCSVLKDAITSTYNTTLDATLTNSLYMAAITAAFTDKGLSLPAGIDDVGDILALCSIDDQVIPGCSLEDAEEITFVWLPDADPKRTLCPDGSLSFTNNARYRFGFNGKENDAETGTQDYGMRIYNPALGKFLSVDPITSKYPELTPYQFASNTPLQAIDLDGLEAQMLWTIYDVPELKDGEWYEIYGPLRNAIDDKSFSTAAKYNTQKNRSNVYTTINQRNSWYNWAHKQVKGKGTYWFSAARDVTSLFAVGAAELPVNLGYIKDDTEQFLKWTNEYLFKHNMFVFGKYVVDGTEISGAEGLTGIQLDNKLVEIEQNKLEDYLKSYKTYYLLEHTESDWSKMVKNINGSFDGTDPLVSLAQPSSLKYALNLFKEKYGDTKFDFLNKSHRIFLGEKMAEYNRNNDK